jgi:hypothetical protein
MKAFIVGSSTPWSNSKTIIKLTNMKKLKLKKTFPAKLSVIFVQFSLQK